MEYAPEYKLVPRRPSVDLIANLPATNTLDVSNTTYTKVELEAEPIALEQNSSRLQEIWDSIRSKLSSLREG